MRSLATFLALFVLMLGPAAALAQQPPSLADVARKEAERRKAVKGATKVYTNADVGRGGPLTTAAATPLAEGAAPAAETKPAAAKPDEAKEKEDVRDEAWWRDRVTRARTQLDRNRLFAEALQSRINALWADFTARDDPAQRAVIEANRNEALAELDRVNGEIARQEQAIADIEEEARKAGVPPGWLR